MSAVSLWDGGPQWTGRRKWLASNLQAAITKSGTTDLSSGHGNLICQPQGELVSETIFFFFNKNQYSASPWLI